MKNKYIAAVEAAQVKTEIPSFEIGDEVEVGVRIIEGTKERTQPFIGTVIARRGGIGVGAMFTVRRIVNNEGVERVFPLHSPRVAHVKVQRKGKTRRAKLYYLRDRVGKSRRLRERKNIARGTEAESVSGDAPAVRPSRTMEAEPAGV
ncbi:MAG: 50S ribosomal protein L19 [Planctomycetes bacterium]|nr:50S ribosomal protein L19 [Planctomycetota bacterium]